jgi:hypothetical protein
MAKKPRQHLQLEERPRRRGQIRTPVVRVSEYVNCSDPSCHNIIARWACEGQAGRVYCSLHRGDKP